SRKGSTSNRSHPFDDQATVHSTPKTVLCCFLIGRTVVPGAGLLDRRELGYDDALDFRAFERHVWPICRQHLDGATFHRCTDLGPVGFQLRLGLLAGQTTAP